MATDGSPSPYSFRLRDTRGNDLGVHEQPWGEDYGEEWDSSIASDYATEALTQEGYEVDGVVLPIDEEKAIDTASDEDVPWDPNVTESGIIRIRRSNRGTEFRRGTS